MCVCVCVCVCVYIYMREKDRWGEVVREREIEEERGG